MFQKEGSYRGGAGSKKAKDTPIKKSERRKLRSACLSLLERVSETDTNINTNTNSNTNAADNGSSNENANEDENADSQSESMMLSSMLDSIFLDTKADISLRKIKQPNAKSNAGATLIYIRTPSSSSASASASATTTDSNESNTITKWPYTKKDQPILIQMSTSIPTSTGTKSITITLPTVALLSTLPPQTIAQLPTIIVPSQVSKYVCRGANLMRSGMISILNVDFKSKNWNRTRQWVCIRVNDNNSGNNNSTNNSTNIQQPFAIGLLTNNTTNDNILGSTLGNGGDNSNNKGIGVEIVTCYGDDLYKSQISASTSTSNKGNGHGHGHGHGDNNGGIISLLGGGLYDDGDYGNVGFDGGKIVHGLIQVNDDGNGNEDGNDVDTIIGKLKIDHDGDDNNDNDNKNVNSDNNSDDDEEEQISEEEKNLLYAFHTSLLVIDKQDLPMAISTYYTQYLLPSRKEGTFIELKQTKYKKITTFLLDQSKNCMEHCGHSSSTSATNTTCIITIGASKDKQDPVAFLTGINRSHIDLRDAKRRIKEEVGCDNNDDHNNHNNQTNSGSGKSKKRKMAVVNLYVIPNNVAKLLRLDDNSVKAGNAKSEERRGTGFLTSPECRDILNQYVQENDLVDEFDPEHVILDGPLTDVFFRKTKKQITSGARQNDYPESITRKEMNIKWLEKMEGAHAVVSMPGSVIIAMKRGKPPMVTIEVESRQNRRKFTTRLRGLEEYTINPSEFANDVAKRFACSASVENEHTLSAGRAMLKKGRSELVFQGHLLEELQALLTGNEKLSSHGGSKGSSYCLPKGVFDIILKKGVPRRKK